MTRRMSYDPIELAKNLCQQNLRDTPVSSPRCIAEFLGDCTPLSKETLSHYMKQIIFDFSGLGLLSALRIFSSHLLLSGETHKLDRVLHAFACEYYNSLHKNNFDNLSVSATEKGNNHMLNCGESIVTISSPSKNILTPQQKSNNNHDLPEEKNITPLEKQPLGFFGNFSKFLTANLWSKTSGSELQESKLIKNGIINSESFKSNQMEPIFWAKIENRDTCISIIHLIVFSLLLLNTDLRGHEIVNHMTQDEFVTNTLNAISDLGMSDIFTEQLSILLSDYYLSLNSHKLQHPEELDTKSHRSIATTAFFGSKKIHTSRDSTHTTKTARLWRKFSGQGDETVFKKSFDSIRTAIIRKTSNHHNIVESTMVIKQQNLKKKFLIAGSERASDRSWRTCLLQMTTDILIMSPSTKQNTTFKNVHCVAISLEECSDLDYNCTRQNVFVLFTYNGGIILFECPSAHDVEYWVRAINVANAQNTIGTDLALLSSVFGWESGLVDLGKSQKISPWREPSQNMRINNVSLVNQRVLLNKELSKARREYVKHVENHSNVLSILSSEIRQIALDNWQRRFEFLCRETTKWQTYVLALGESGPKFEVAPLISFNQSSSSEFFGQNGSLPNKNSLAENNTKSIELALNAPLALVAEDFEDIPNDKP